MRRRSRPLRGHRTTTARSASTGQVSLGSWRTVSGPSRVRIPRERTPPSVAGHHSTSTDIARTEPRIAVMPVGSFEPQGNHLPLATDRLIASAVAYPLFLSSWAG
ncbi:creatininase family protein [Nocardia cyriacigeorgica]|nr:creatininase family protein [Nocardia cyriacigeorgica]MBF6090668.1 creatininase family protein [Nocardia cyriacigeorgica]MBF6095596.1 creatininase family protein [Nocardia cyriacigeorgica]MBF6096524.1 creatininase family protein [Nocardia cyriacigeorgica]MBF6162939.1 creatininase family protein [Nocardia cyriacigeorgica]MBF6201897.1 creatininase family protein [Nocardia cyriacigeorgica]